MAPSKHTKLHRQPQCPTLQRPHQPQPQHLWCKLSTTLEPQLTPRLQHLKLKSTRFTPPPVQLLQQQHQQPHMCIQASTHAAQIGIQPAALLSSAATTRAPPCSAKGAVSMVTPCRTARSAANMPTGTLSVTMPSNAPAKDLSSTMELPTARQPLSVSRFLSMPTRFHLHHQDPTSPKPKSKASQSPTLLTSAPAQDPTLQYQESTSQSKRMQQTTQATREFLRRCP
jgi:hypothetical protein